MKGKTPKEFIEVSSRTLLANDTNFGVRSPWLEFETSCMRSTSLSAALNIAVYRTMSGL